MNVLVAEENLFSLTFFQYIFDVFTKDNNSNIATKTTTTTNISLQPYSIVPIMYEKTLFYLNWLCYAYNCDNIQQNHNAICAKQL